MITLPVTSIAAPSHHSPGNDSPKMMKLSTAVTIKLADVFIILTRTEEDASVRERVKRPHMMALNRRLQPKKRPRIVYSTKGFDSVRPHARAIALDQVAVSSVVVLHRF